MPLPFDAGIATISAQAAAHPPIFNRARAVGAYAGALQSLIHGFKYSDRHDARRLFGRWLVVAGKALIEDCDLIVPIPLNRWRLLERRFNQSAMLALEVGRISQTPVRVDALTRYRRTRSQVGLTTLERHANVANAFAVAKSVQHDIVGRRVLVVDDVITTGATSNAAATALLRAGAVRVDVLALALVTHTVS